jgi:hypothetical protein
VKAQHDRRERKKITKSMKEICAHLNLQPPSSHIASEGEESPEIESFEERIARFEDKTPVQQWYGEASLSGFSFDYGGMDGASSSLPPLAQTHDDEEEEEEGDEEDDDDECSL